MFAVDSLLHYEAYPFPSPRRTFLLSLSQAAASAPLGLTNRWVWHAPLGGGATIDPVDATLLVGAGPVVELANV